MSIGAALFGIIILMFLAGLPVRARSKIAKPHLSYGLQALFVALVPLFVEHI